eukprot:scaffold71589_cov28-Attheya_sp.AAC.1
MAALLQIIMGTASHHFTLLFHILLKTMHLRHGMGIETGIDLDRLIDAGNFISGVIGRQTRSKVAAAMKKSSP